ncbi:MAG: YcjF family protein [bacterium]
MDLELIERDGSAERIILRHTKSAMLRGAIPVPFLDLAFVSAVHVDLLMELARVYQVELEGRIARTVATSVTGAVAGLTVARISASLVKALPFGWTTGALTQVLVSGATTYALGRLVKRLFRENRPLEELDLRLIGDELKENFTAGLLTARKLLAQVKSLPGPRR